MILCLGEFDVVMTKKLGGVVVGGVAVVWMMAVMVALPRRK